MLNRKYMIDVIAYNNLLILLLLDMAMKIEAIFDKIKPLLEQQGA